MSKATLKVSGISCGHCVASIEGALKKIGVQGNVDLASKTVSVEYDEAKTTLDTVKGAIEDQGYDVVE